MAWQHVSRVAGLAVIAALLSPTLWLREPTTAATPDADGLGALIASLHRSGPNIARDRYRRPADVLRFVGLTPDTRVIEISPGAAGYWTEIIAPFVRERGQYTAAGSAPAALIAGDPARYGRVQVVAFTPDKVDIAPAGSADLVLTFRNLHNWMAGGKTEQALAAFHKALKPGGILGIEEHRGRKDTEQDPLAKTGYVRQDHAIALIEKAGFKFVGASEAVANPRDTKDHPAGVWTLPPTWRLGDTDRAKYAAIGESDRFLLKFVKP